MVKPANQYFQGLHLKRWEENSCPISWNTFQEPVLGLAGMEVLFFIPVCMMLRFELVTRTVNNTPISWLVLKSACTASRPSLFLPPHPQCLQAALTRGWEGTQLRGNLSCLQQYFTPYNIMLRSKAEGTFSPTQLLLWHRSAVGEWLHGHWLLCLPLLLFFPFIY